jgi:NAD(P)-dependent dehydrogenase (short-subunit alcohol dehydrogenase family)
MIERAVATFGRLDMAFSNAAVQVPPSDAADERDENFDRVNALNLRGVWTCMKHELRQTRARGSGAIVDCSSLGGYVGLRGRAAYYASKPRVIGLTKSAAFEYASRGVRINTVCCVDNRCAHGPPALQPWRELWCGASSQCPLHGALTVLAAKTFTEYGRVG